VGAVTGQAQTSRGDLAGTENCGEDRVTLDEVERLPIENELRRCHVGRG
jgi:hypothetical protein